MATLYIRDVPEEIAEALRQRASSEGKSLSAFVNAELAKIATLPTNAMIVEKLRSMNRDGGPTAAEIVGALRAERR